MNVLHDALVQNFINDSAPLSKRLPEHQIRNILKTSPPEPLTQIQNNFTELFLIIPSNKIAQMITLRWKKGLPEL